METKDFRPSPAMVVACLALFVALGSGAYAAVKLKPNSVKAKNIKANAVTGPKIASNAVSAGKIANNAVTAAKIENSAVTSPKIADLAVNNAKLGLNSVATGKIADDAVTTQKIGPGAVTKGKFAVTGTATNTFGFSLNNTCTVASFTATGVRAGDVVAFSFRDAPTVGGLLVAQPAEDMVTTDVLKLQVCEVNAAPANIAVGSLIVDFVAVR